MLVSRGTLSSSFMPHSVTLDGSVMSSTAIAATEGWKVRSRLEFFPHNPRIPLSVAACFLFSDRIASVAV
jgi:hypothetical protein